MFKSIKMKHIYRIIIMVIIGMFCFSQMSFAQDKALSKALDKEYKQKLRQYKKEGWAIDGDRSVQVTLLKHFAKLEANPELRVIEGTASNCKSTNICKQVALNNAQNEYARQISAKIEGAFASITKHNSIRPQEDMDKMTGGLINEVCADLSGLLVPSYSIYREKRGVKEYKTYFFVNVEQVVENVEKVLEKSIKETKLTIEEAKAISKFVGDELKNESGVDTDSDSE